jgi:hypothetical protein
MSFLFPFWTLILLPWKIPIHFEDYGKTRGLKKIQSFMLTQDVGKVQTIRRQTHRSNKGCFRFRLARTENEVAQYK